MEKVIIIRYSEIFLKGKNRGYFENVFASNIEKALSDIPHELKKTSGRYLIEDFDVDETDKIVSRLKKVFGIHSMSIAIKVETDMDKIFEAAKVVSKKSGTFKVESHRADKTFYLNSVEISRKIGGRLLRVYEDLKVDIHEPDFYVYIDLRENGTTLVFSEFFAGPGGMPVGTAGKGLLMISGGIDSPVAGHMIAKRGMKVDCLHFHSYPYTNMQAKQKVVDLAKVLSSYEGGLNLYVVSVTHIQESIHEKCAEDLMVTMLRRFMFRIAERLAKRKKMQCLITGESLGQVASQTIEGMTSSNSVVEDLPILRPLVGFDKNEIIERSVNMGAYDISILPYEDCCTVFLPRHPVIKPKMDYILENEARLDVEGLLNEAFASIEKIEL